MNQDPNEIFKEYAKHSRDNELEILQSHECGCYFCRHMFSARDVSDWVEENQHVMALCPECGMDTVIGDSSGVPLSKEMLKEMNEFFYGKDKDIDDESASLFCRRYEAGKISHKEKNEDLYVTYLRQLFAHGSREAALALGRIYETGGEFRQIDLPMAIAIYNTSLMRIDPAAMVRLAQIYLLDKDPNERAKAFDLAAKACAFGDPAGLFLLADCIITGSGTEVSIDIAFELIERGFRSFFMAFSSPSEAYLNAFAQCAYRLAKFYQHGVGDEKDMLTSLQLYLYGDLACRCLAANGFQVPAPVHKDLQQEILAICEKQGYKRAEAPYFDGDMFYDSFNFCQDETVLKTFRLVDFDEPYGRLTFDLVFHAPYPLVDTGTVTSILANGTTHWDLANILAFSGEKEFDFTRIGEGDEPDCFYFYYEDKPVGWLRLKAYDDSDEE